MSSFRLRTLAAVLSVLFLPGCESYERLKGELDRAERANEQLIDQYNRLQQRRDAQRAAVAISPGDIAGIEGAEVEDGGLSLGAGFLFNSGEAGLKSEQLPVLDEVAKMLKTKYSGQKIIVEGHTDNEPLEQVTGASEYNLKLGFERATNVFKYLNLKHGISQERVALFSYGTSKPLRPETGHSPEGRKKNRRVVFRLSAHHY